MLLFPGEIAVDPEVRPLSLKQAPAPRISSDWIGTDSDAECQLRFARALAVQLHEEGIQDIVLLGIGGSARAAEAIVLAEAHHHQSRLHVIDTIVPRSVGNRLDSLDPRRTFVIVSSRSGRTAETDALHRIFIDWLERHVADAWRQHVGVISVPHTPLDAWARAYDVRARFVNSPSIVGRFSALSLFGLVPPLLVNTDIDALIERARGFRTQRMAAELSAPLGPQALGEELVRCHRQGRWKLTIHTSSRLRAFGRWLEQLIAESTGKQATGILPVLNEPIADPTSYGDDRVFATLDLSGTAPAVPPPWTKALERAGHPVLRFVLDDATDLGAEFVRWEVACVVAAQGLGVNPFDQPAVMEVKERTEELLAGDRARSALGKNSGGLQLPALRAALANFTTDSYVALEAFLPSGRATEELVQSLRRVLAERRGLTTTADYGPRSLHASGQFHNDGRAGCVLQLYASEDDDLPIPGRTFTLQDLLRCLRVADVSTLRRRGRCVVPIDLSSISPAVLHEVVTAGRSIQGAAQG